MRLIRSKFKQRRGLLVTIASKPAVALLATDLGIATLFSGIDLIHLFIRNIQLYSRRPGRQAPHPDQRLTSSQESTLGH